MIEMARRLDEAVSMEDAETRTDILHDLVRRNWRMWTILQAALVDPESTVPAQIRENLLNLTNFIDKRSVEFLADPAPEKVAVLININKQIGAGLMGNPSDDPKEAERLRREAAERQQVEATVGDEGAASQEASGTDDASQQSTTPTDTEV